MLASFSPLDSRYLSLSVLFEAYVRPFATLCLSLRNPNRSSC